MLLAEAAAAGVTLRLRQEVTGVQPIPNGYQLTITKEKRSAGETLEMAAPSVVLASGGLSLPKIASDLPFAQRTRCK